MQALALKYRPKDFSELLGQDVVKDSLSHALDSGRLGHAYLFSGLRGSGKTSSARIFAKALLCETGVSASPCGVCDHCKAAAESRHLDIIELDAASHRKIDDIRDLIEQTRYAPASGRFKIFIIDEAHMLTTEASNALLKTLEEPPAYIKFILATTNPLKLPPTILSRTQHFRFKPISRAVILGHLSHILGKEGISFEAKALEILCRSGSGSLRDTLTLLDQAIIFCHENVTQKGVADMLGLLDPEISDNILKTLATCDKTALLALIKTLPSSDAELVIDELIALLKEKFIAGDLAFSPLIYERFFRILSEAKTMLAAGSDGEFTLYIALFMMLEAFNLTNIDDAIDEQRQRISAPQAALAGGYQQQLRGALPPQMPQPAQAFQPSAAPQNLSQPQPQPAPTLLNQPAANYHQKYASFVQKIFDRSEDLGQVFDSIVLFGGFEDGTLTLICTEPKGGPNRQKITDLYKEAVLPLARSVFGDGTKIAVADQTPSTQNALQKLSSSMFGAPLAQNAPINPQTAATPASSQAVTPQTAADFAPQTAAPTQADFTPQPAQQMPSSDSAIPQANFALTQAAPATAPQTAAPAQPQAPQNRQKVALTLTATKTQNDLNLAQLKTCFGESSFEPFGNQQ